MMCAADSTLSENGLSGAGRVESRIHWLPQMVLWLSGAGVVEYKIHWLQQMVLWLILLAQIFRF
jgi:hypothetical protein